MGISLLLIDVFNQSFFILWNSLEMLTISQNYVYELFDTITDRMAAANANG